MKLNKLSFLLIPIAVVVVFVGSSMLGLLVRFGIVEPPKDSAKPYYGE